MTEAQRAIIQDYQSDANVTMERIRANDPKGIGPLIWAALEMDMLTQ